MPLHFDLTDQPPEPARRVLLEGLLAHNQHHTGLRDHRPLAILLRDAQQQVIGGLWGRTGYRWLFVELLYVPEAHRGQQVGRRLLAQAEQEALVRGCVGAWLDTFEFQARGFYERLGYQVFGAIDDYPPGFARYYLRKHFAQPETPSTR